MSRILFILSRTLLPFKLNYAHYFLFRVPILSAWGVTAGVAVLFFGERIPRLRQDIFSRLPVIGDRWASYRKVEEETD